MLTFSFGAPSNRCWNVVWIFLANRWAKTSLSTPNWCRDWRTIESITYNPDTLYSGRHCVSTNRQFTVIFWSHNTVPRLCPGRGYDRHNYMPNALAALETLDNHFIMCVSQSVTKTSWMFYRSQVKIFSNCIYSLHQSCHQGRVSGDVIIYCFRWKSGIPMSAKPEVG